MRERITAASVVERRTDVSGWVFRGVASAHMVALIGQPVFAGIFLSGEHGGLGLHLIGANLTTAIGYLQVIVAIVVLVRLGRRWPFASSLAIAVAETAQYYAGIHIGPWLHVPLGVLIVAAVALQLAAAWRLPLARVSPSSPRTAR
nr:hypothetical protein [Microbacterium bovistercoris]